MALIGKQLITGFLVLVVSSLMFLASPAIAATSSTVPTITSENFETEVLKSDKPVVVILVSEIARDFYPIPLDKVTSEAQNTFGDGYKIVLGTVEANGRAYGSIPTPLIFPPISTVSIYENGKQSKYGYFTEADSATKAFQSLKS